MTFEGKSWTFQCYIKDQHETAVLSRGMSLIQKLERGILAPGLCLFGDIITPFIATPYPAVCGGTRDSYNFYHSQLRISI